MYVCMYVVPQCLQQAMQHREVLLNPNMNDCWSESEPELGCNITRVVVTVSAVWQCLESHQCVQGVLCVGCMPADLGREA
jgi:hypothetical protein